VFVTASIGIAMAEPTSIEASELLRGADVAMYRAKAEGRNGVAVFEPTMHDLVFRRLELEADLRRAIAGDELLLLLQPIVDLRSGEVVGVEALIRWEHPTLGTISPLDFIGMAEESGLIVPLGRWVLGEACRQLALLASRHPAAATMTVSVNVSARQFKQDDLVDDVVAALHATDLRPERLVLEITESVLLESTPQTTANISDLHRLGVGLAIDDFGTGYSSLGYLQRFPIDVLKIDKSFIDGMLDGDVALVRAVVNLGHSLGLSVTAEGCETVPQMENLRALGCDRAQGYLFARPLRLEALLELLDDSLARARSGWAPVSA
jgi:EAL domain-containing protein (putative c-di-GMP-specific phosphodiesterase class I)